LGTVNDILITLIASLAISAFIQGLRIGFGYAIITEENAKIISDKVFNVLTIPSVISSVVSLVTMLVKLFKEIIESILNNS